MRLTNQRNGQIKKLDRYLNWQVRSVNNFSNILRAAFKQFLSAEQQLYV